LNFGAISFFESNDSTMLEDSFILAG